MTDRASDRASSTAEGGKDKIIGEVLANRYQIESRLGEGAMGAVYKARHVKVGRAFAVKVLHSKLLEDSKVAQRFEREAELAGRLRHPNVVGVVDVGETADGLRYMVMDFAHGPDLATLLSEAPMPGPRVLHLTRQLLEGLYHAHEAGLIHRDFKPENVIVEKDAHGAEVPRIVDFGIAILREGGESATAQGRLTTNGLVLGTPHYMAPEQAVADPIDHRIDLFALGIVVYEMLCGKLPFDGTGAEVARANLLLDPPLIAQRVPYLEVDPLLEAFARRLMAKKRDARPATAKAARELLDLIDKDRAAAAAALGVPLSPSREPAVTAPSAPQSRRATHGNETFPPPLAEAAAGDPAAPTDPQRFITTAPVALPSGTADDDLAPARRRPLGIFIGAGLTAAAGIVAIVLATRGKEPAATAAPPPADVATAPVAAPTGPSVPATPTENPVAQPPPPAIPDAGAETIAAVTPDAAVETPKGTPTGAKIPKVAPKKDPKVAKTTRIEPPGTKTDGKTEIKTAPTPPAETPGKLDGNAIAAKYSRVGTQLKKLGDAADPQWWNAWRRIRMMDALKDPKLLAETAAVLAKLEAEMAKSK